MRRNSINRIMLKLYLLSLVLSSIRGFRFAIENIHDLDAKQTKLLSEYLENALTSSFSGQEFFKDTTVTRFLGSGAYGMVFKLVRQSETNEEYTMKVISEEFLDNHEEGHLKEALTKKEDKINILEKNIRMLRYLNGLNTPFVQTVYTYQYILRHRTVPVLLMMNISLLYIPRLDSTLLQLCNLQPKEIF